MDSCVAPDGAAALRVPEASRPDLVVLDLMLPEVDGLSVLARLRATTDVPVIVVTARDLRLIGSSVWTSEPTTIW